MENSVKVGPKSPLSVGLPAVLPAGPLASLSIHCQFQPCRVQLNPVEFNQTMGVFAGFAVALDTWGAFARAGHETKTSWTRQGRGEFD